MATSSCEDASNDSVNIYPTGFILLKPVVHHYPWGVTGETSLVYRLYSQFMDANSASSTPPTLEDRYAELWLGTHTRGPSTVVSPQGDEPLSAHLKRLQSLSPRDGKESEYLGFLLKVLAIDKPLSIQLHPDAAISSQLLIAGHASITDNREKAEVCIALTQFEALYSLKWLKEIVSEAQQVPEFGEFLKASGCGDILAITDFSDSKECYRQTIRIVQCILGSENSGDELLAQLTSRLEHAADVGSSLSACEELLLRLHQSFPNDSGIWFGLIMNYVRIEPGNALFVPPNTIHSYISGTCVECMASSDNVIRGGLTRKHTDHKAVLQCLNRTFNTHSVSFIDPVPVDKEQFIVLYEVPHISCNFSVARICVPPGERVEYVPKSQSKCAIAIVIASNPSVEFSAVPISPRTTSPTAADERYGTLFAPKLGTALLIYPGTSIRVYNGHNASICGDSTVPETFMLPDVSAWFVMFIAYSKGCT